MKSLLLLLLLASSAHAAAATGQLSDLDTAGRLDEIGQRVNLTLSDEKIDRVEKLISDPSPVMLQNRSQECEMLGEILAMIEIKRVLVAGKPADSDKLTQQAERTLKLQEGYCGFH